MYNLQDVDLKLLRAFRAVVEAGGVVGAQAALNSAQSTVSTQLLQLERRLGFRLCLRGRSGFSLTPAGQQIYTACLNIFAATDHLQNVAASIAGELRGTLRIGIVDAMMTNYAWSLPAIMQSFADRAKDSLIELRVDPPSTLEQYLAEGKRDVAIAAFHTRRKGLTYLPIFNEKQALYCSKDHPLHSAKTVTLANLQRHSFVARRFDLERVGNVKPRAMVENMEAQTILILTGRFIGFLPSQFADSLPAHARLKKLTVTPDVDYHATFYVAIRDNGEENLLVRAFLNKVRQVTTQPISSI